MTAWLLTREEVRALALSVQVSLVAVLLTAPLGIATGWLLARRHFWGKTLVETVVNLPLVMPPVVTGYLLLVVFGRRGWLGGLLDRWLGIRLVFDWKGVALAAAVMAFPLMVRSMRLAFAAVDERLEQAARTLGATAWGAFRSITLPLAWHGLVAGCVLAFARAIGEFGATIMIAGNIPGETRTLPLAIYTLLESPDGEHAARRLVLISIAIAAAAILVGELLHRRMERRLRA